jgi:hypothetical protein
MKCKNCKFWEFEHKATEKYEVNIGYCDIQPFQVSSMKSNQMAILCGHDGLIYTGEDFGCINFEAKK